MSTSICPICQQEFQKHNGKQVYCKPECYEEARRRQAKTPEQRARHARKTARRRENNPESVKEESKRSRTKHREQRAEDNRQFHKNNPDYRREYTREYRANLGPGARKQEHATYYQTHKEQVSKRVSAYNKANPDVLQLKNSRRRALLANAPGNWTRQEFKELCEAVDYYCSYCHERFDKLTADHIIPLSRGGSNDITNIIPACGPCNYSKQDKTPLEFIKPLKLS